jgi:hypothetical protein
MQRIISHLVSLVLDEIHDATDLERVVSRLQLAAHSLQELCRDDGLPIDPSGDPKLLTSMEPDDDPADDDESSPCEED